MDEQSSSLPNFHMKRFPLSGLISIQNGKVEDELDEKVADFLMPHSNQNQSTSFLHLTRQG